MPIHVRKVAENCEEKRTKESFPAFGKYAKAKFTPSALWILFIEIGVSNSRTAESATINMALGLIYFIV
jgi:hypothetical protein